MKIVKRKKGGFYGLGNTPATGNEVIPILTTQTQPAPPTIRVGEPVTVGKSVSLCGGMSLESMLIIGGAVAIVGIIAHYATK